MAEYNEVIKQFKRMCKSVTPMKCTRGECPMGCENIGQCRKVAFERPAKFEKQVMSWAEENPEPVYPTWGEWLCEQGVVVISPSPRYEEDFERLHYLTPVVRDPIPADIAQKLGIEPKGDV